VDGQVPWAVEQSLQVVQAHLARLVPAVAAVVARAVEQPLQACSQEQWAVELQLWGLSAAVSVVEDAPTMVSAAGHGRADAQSPMPPC
jgi:hypothetical protein